MEAVMNGKIREQAKGISSMEDMIPRNAGNNEPEV